jgi:N6-L-threonylcarbamoyladenine synthase
MSHITILGIESSCDDTSAAVLRDGIVLSNLTANQSIHEKYGGVVPELASRAHQENILPVVHQALSDARLKLEDIDAVAYTLGPGLMGSLMVGSSFAKGLSIGLNKPLIEVHHMKAHVLAHMIIDDAQEQPEFPFLCLVVSGGHTLIVKAESPMDMTILGTTLDDAAGEAFDKCAKILGFPYPGGPLIDQNANGGDPHRFRFPVSDIPNLDYSFSGLKTAVLYFIRDQVKADPKFIESNLIDICASIQYTIVKTLMQKLELAIKQTGINQVGIAGGVSANSLLRSNLLQLKERGVSAYVPKFEFCTDNAAMIAIYGHYMYKEGFLGKLEASPQARLEF